MNYNEAIDNNKVDFGNMPPQPFLLGLLSAFDNRYQASADSFFHEITWKQFFAIICTNLCKKSPTINELSEIMGSSHQNVKQIINKMEKSGYVITFTDPDDKRKVRVKGTEKLTLLGEKYNEKGSWFLEQLFRGIDDNDLEVTCRTMAAIENNLINLK